MTVVPFDEPVTVRHLPADGRDRCLRAVPVVRRVAEDRPELGSLLRVYACTLDRGHDGPCEPERAAAARVTRCGLPMQGPWVPEDAALDCPACFPGASTYDEPLLIEEDAGACR